MLKKKKQKPKNGPDEIQKRIFMNQHFVVFLDEELVGESGERPVKRSVRRSKVKGYK